MIEQHYTADEVAAKLHVHVSTVFREAAAGRLRSVVIGRSRRFPESAIEEWLSASDEKHRVGDTVVSIDRRG